MLTSSYKIVSREVIERDTWNDFVDANDEAWLWHRAELQDALGTWPGRSDAGFAVLNSEKRVLVVVPLHRVDERMGGVVPTARLESFGGPAFADGLSEKRRSAVAGRVREELVRLGGLGSVREVLLSLSPLAPALRGEKLPRVNPLLIDLGCENVLTQTWVINLAGGIGRVWDRLEVRARRAVRKAEKARILIRPARNEEDDLAAYYALHCETYGRSGIEPHPREYFEHIWAEVLTAGMCNVFFAECGDEVVAAANFGAYKGAAWYWTGASSEAGLRSRANSLLQWAAICQYCEHGFQWFESGEAFPSAAGKLRGISDFKKSFGGELHPLYRGRIATPNAMGRVRQAVKALRGDA